MAQARPRASRKGADRPAPAAGTDPPPLCSVSFCPICMAVTTASELRPEFVEHLMAAGRELMLALRTVIDARLEGLDPPVKLERLTIE
jgi:hypothetical protein